MRSLLAPNTKFLRKAAVAIIPALSALATLATPVFSQEREQNSDTGAPVVSSHLSILSISTRSAWIDASTKQLSIPRSSDRACDAALAQLKQRLIADRQLRVPAQWEGEVYGNSPEGRPIVYSVAVEGPAAASVLNSPQLLQEISTAFINECDLAAAVSIGLYRAGGGDIFGIVEGQVKRFGCAEDIGIEPGPMVVDRPMPWGYHYCTI